MRRRVKPRVEWSLSSSSAASSSKGKDEVVDSSSSSSYIYLDWLRLPYDTVIDLFTRLNNRDRASLSSTCTIWRKLGASPCLWRSLDLRHHKFDLYMANTLTNRCENLRSIRFRGVDSAEALSRLRAKNIVEISGDHCKNLTDATLSMIASRHDALESLQLVGPEFCDHITSHAIRVIAYCCPNLKKLRISGLRDVTSDAIESLAENCTMLTDLGFLDCFKIDEEALGKVVTLRYLSVAGTKNINWKVAMDTWNKLPLLAGLDVSRTDICYMVVSRLLNSLPSLKVLCAMNCTLVEGKAFFRNPNEKVLFTLFDDKIEASIFDDVKNDKTLSCWLQWMTSHALLRIAEGSSLGLKDFWLKPGASMLIRLMQNSQEDVQERAATGLATFIVVNGVKTSIDSRRAEAVMKEGGIKVLLELAKSWREGLQAEVAKAIANLTMNRKAAKAVAKEGGISVLADLAKSMNRLVSEEAAGGLWNLSVGEAHKGEIAQTGAVKSLVELIIRSIGCDLVLERAVGALANLAVDEKCSVEVAEAGGIQVMAMLTSNCKNEGVQEQSARALANLAAHGDINDNNEAIGNEPGAIQSLVQLLKSPHEGVKLEAAGALWNLTFGGKNREYIAAYGGIEALVALAKSGSNASKALQERVAGVLWGLSVTQTISVSIGHQGGVPALIDLAQSRAEDVHETAAGALWNLAYNPCNALHIVEGGGVDALVNICSTSGSKMACFMAALTLAYMLDGRMDEYLTMLRENTSKDVSLDGDRIVGFAYIEAFIASYIEPEILASAALPSSPTMLAEVAEKARIKEAGHLRCNSSEIGRFITMLRNPSPILKTCSAFALLQFTLPGGRHAMHHVSLLQTAGARVLRSAAAAANMPRVGKIIAKIVLRNLEYHQGESSNGKNEADK